MDEMWLHTVAPTYPRTFVGLTAMCERAAATLAHLVMLLGRAQRRPCKHRKPPRRLINTPTFPPDLHLLEGRSESIGGHMIGWKRMGTAPASTTQPSSP